MNCVIYRGRIDAIWQHYDGIEDPELIFVTLEDENGTKFETVLKRSYFGELAPGKRLFVGVEFEMHTINKSGSEHCVRITFCEIQIPSRESIWKEFG